jgi:hypothetical protein
VEPCPGGHAFTDPPSSAAWRHLDARDGFEVVFLRSVGDSHRIDGSTTAVEDGAAWAVGYSIGLDREWVTRTARVRARTEAGTRALALEADGAGHWRVDGAAAPELDGCLDVDLESSAFTNALPVHRLRLAPGEESQAPAAYVRALDLSVQRLEQGYVRLEDDGTRERYDYAAPAFEFACRLVYDESGLVLDYPGIAVRVAAVG